MKLRIAFVVTMLAVPATSCSSSSSGCGSAKKQALAYLQAGAAAASARPNPDYGKTYPGSTTAPLVVAGRTVTPGYSIPSSTDTALSLPGNAQAASQQYLLASYVIVQHKSCFTDAELATAQERIDQSKQ